MRLSMLVTILEGLVLGLRGKRRSALSAALSEVRVEAEEMEGLVGRLRRDTSEGWNLAERRSDEIAAFYEDLRKAHDNVLALEEDLQAAHEARPHHNDGEWGVWVRRRVLSTHKILCIKAVRQATSLGLGLKEAKDMVESEVLDCYGPEDWFCLSRHCTSRELGLTLDTLLQWRVGLSAALRNAIIAKGRIGMTDIIANALHLETDVKFEKTCEPKYY